MLDQMYRSATDQIAANHGCSVDNLGQAPVYGFMVSTGRHERRIPAGDALIFEAIRDYLAEHIDEWRRGAYFGVWGWDHEWYLDVSERFQDRETALSAARQRGEIAIWDVVAGREIHVDQCSRCLDHPGWAHGDESRRSEPRDVCRSCYGI